MVDLFSLDSKHYGVAYDEWTARWWQWLLSIPEDINPIFDSTGEGSGINQDGPVWFLAGTYQPIAKRSFSIPQEKAILIPVINIECSYAENPDIKDDSELLSCAKFLIDHATQQSATIDGESFGQGGGITRVQSPVFQISFPANNIWKIREGLTSAVSDGYWIFLNHLAPGNHRIHIHGEATFPNYNVVKDITYDLAVDGDKTTGQMKQSGHELENIPSSSEKDLLNKLPFKLNELVKRKYYAFICEGKEYYITKSDDKLIDIYELIGDEQRAR